MRKRTAAELLDRLHQHNLLDRGRVLSVFNRDIESATFADLEAYLIQSSIVAEEILRGVKAELFGTAPAPSGVGPVNAFPIEVARAANAVAVDAPDVPTVAFAEPTPDKVSIVAKYLDAGPGEWRVTTTTHSHLHALLESLYGKNGATYPPVERLEEIMEEAVRSQASDFHLVVGQPPFLRIASHMQPMQRAPLSGDFLEKEIRRIAGEERFAYLEENFDADQSFTHEGMRFRLNYGRDQNGYTVVGRLIPVTIPTPEQIGLSDAIVRFGDLERGLVLVTGPTGSGKSTTLASILQDVAFRRPARIITLEDPIEFKLNSARALVSQRELHRDFTDFSTALRQALRQDPDIILVGEMRDPETMKVAMTAAETGHLVFATLHTYDAVSTVGRIISSFPAEEQDQIRTQLAYILAGVVSQTLCRRATGGRVAAHEIMVANTAIQANLASPGGMANLRNTIETSSRDGMQTLEQSLAKLVRGGVITREEALFRARRKKDLQHLLERQR